MKQIFALLFPLAILLVAGSPGINGDFPLIVGANRATITVTSATWGPSAVGVLGGDLPAQADFTQAAVVSAFTTIGTSQFRIPQGNWANGWNPTANTNCNGLTFDTNTTLPLAISNYAATGLLVIVPDGSNCAVGVPPNPIDPSPAASVVNLVANTDACVTKCPYYTYLNETYQLSANDQACGHSASCYKANYLTTRTRMLAQNAGIKVCVGGDPQHSGTNPWDSIVFASPYPDCTDSHYYYFTVGGENDPGLLNNVNSDFTVGFINVLKAEMATAGMPASTPILLGEIGSDTSTYTIQAQSIVEALWYAQMVGEMENDGVTAAYYHLGFNNCQYPPSTPPPATTLYPPWLSWTAASMISNDQTVPVHTCTTGVIPSPSPPATGTILPAGAASQVLSHFVKSGETILKTTVVGSKIVAYATTYSGAYAVLIVNLSDRLASNVTVSIAGHASGSGGNVYTYSKAIYDASSGGAWNGPTTTSLGAWTTNFTLTVPPWSLVVVQTG
jgi:hypothetical protein